MLTASALPSGSASTAASASSGRRTVRDCTIESYCSKSPRREARLGLASSASRASRALAPAGSRRTGGPYPNGDVTHVYQYAAPQVTVGVTEHWSCAWSDQVGDSGDFPDYFLGDYGDNPLWFYQQFNTTNSDSGGTGPLATRGAVTPWQTSGLHAASR